MATSAFKQKVPLRVKIQRIAAQIVYGPGLWWVILAIKLMGTKIENHKEIRKKYKELTNEKYPPLLICPNHMTYIDSVILILAFGNHFWYPFHFRRHMWNLVAKEYSKNILFRFVCYFSKCIYIDRASEVKDDYPTLKTAEALLERGEVVLIFPEGRRTKTGRFDDARLAYGIGKIAANLGECRVLCTYLRAPEQGDKATGFPPKNAHYKIYTDLVHYKATEWGGKPSTGITLDIAERIKKLETKYFVSLETQ